MTASLHQLLRSFDHGQRATGAPLWTYSLSHDDLERLAQELQRAFDRGEDSSVVDGGFCLFAAHHFCRTHAGGPWTWTAVLAACGWPHGVGAMLYRSVRRGLRYWKCGGVHNTESRSLYQRTLACQGGLPLKLLAGSNRNALQQYFTRILQSAELYREPASAFTEHHAALLPLTLRNPLVYDLTAQLIDAIVALRRRPEVRCADPLEALDRTEPTWRNRIPLHLEDEVATQLLRGLLRTAQTEPEGPTAAIVEAVLSLRLDGPPRLVRGMRFRDGASEAALQEMLGLAKGNDLPPYFVLSMLLPDGSRRAFANAQRYGDLYRLAPDGPEHPIRRGEGLLGTVRVVASIGSTDLGLGEVPGGQPIPEELPWVLAGHELTEIMPIRRLGAARSSADTLYLLLPADSVLSPAPGASFELLPDKSPPGRTLVRLRGSAAWDQGEERCTFSTGRAETDARLSLSGRIASFGFMGAEVWSGAPVVVQHDDRRQTRVGLQHVQWRPLHAREWRPYAQAPLGDVLVRVRSAGETIFRTRATIVPPGLEIKPRAVVQGRGELRVRHPQVEEVRVAQAEGLTTDVQRLDQGEFRIAITTAQGSPSALRLCLRFRGGLQAELDVTCPVQVRQFVGFDGRRIPSLAVRSVDRLGGVRARAVEPRDNGLELTARVRYGGTPWRRIAPLESHGSGAYELSLDAVHRAVATLLARRDELDATVELRIEPRSGARNECSEPMLVGTYDARFQPGKDQEGRVVAIELDPTSAEFLGLEGIALLRTELRRLDDPTAPPVELEKLSDGGQWRVPADLAPGPWLALGWQGEWSRVRPLLVNVPGEPAEELDEFQRAVHLPDAFERRVAFDTLLAKLERDNGHPLWDHIDGVIEQFEGLPAKTYDLARRIADRPATAALLALRRGQRVATLWKALEELPFMWHTLPVDAWIRAARVIQEAAVSNALLVKHLGGVAPATKVVFEPFWKALPKQASFMQVILELIGTALPHAPACANPQIALATTPPGQAFIKAQIERESQAVRRRNANRRWPDEPLREGIDAALCRAAVSFRMTAPESSAELVFDAPLIAAAAAVHGIELSDDVIFELRLLREFDPTWFDFAHAVSLTRLLAHERSKTTRSAHVG